ncbi:MAG: 3'(2'),5'-bisphosphate nucleotidase CysQ [Deltaproteobacteria bacterium]|nr:3'(2'),5'-bisphosphate nucleotidase CysQ [Deltaproteobacteria bacterium]
MSKHALEEELEVARRLILEAGERIMSHYGQVDVEHKAGDEPVTAADREANALLVEGLSRAFPEDGILAEESRPSADWHEKRRIWCIDPVDGTKEFIAQNGEFAAMVGLVVEGRAALGLVLMPARGLLYYGGPDLPTVEEKLETGERRELKVSDRADFSEMGVAISRSHRSERVGGMVERLGVTREVRSGSVGVKLAMVGNGEVDLYLHPSGGTKRWDACGPDAILAGAGGVLTDFHGRPIDYVSGEVHNDSGLLASNGTRHAEIVELLADLTEEAGL